MLLSRTLESIGRAALGRALDVEAPPVLRQAQTAQHGDYQLNGVLPLAKQLKRPPRELAQKVVEELAGHEVFSSAEIGGPGFVNLRLAPAWVAARLGEDLADP